MVFCAISNGSGHIVIATAKGQGIRFKEDEVRSMGRQAAGVIGIRIRKGDYVVGMEVVYDGDDILFATEKGYGKRVRIQDFRVAHRAGVGVRTIPTSGRNGLVIGLALVGEHSHVLLIDQAGKIIRLSPSEIRTMGRQAQGVRLIKLDADQKLSSVVAFEEEGAVNDDAGSTSGSSKKATVRADGSEGDDNTMMQFDGDTQEHEMFDESAHDSDVDHEIVDSMPSNDDMMHM